MSGEQVDRLGPDHFGEIAWEILASTARKLYENLRESGSPDASRQGYVGGRSAWCRFSNGPSLAAARR